MEEIQLNELVRTRFAPSPTGHMHIGNVRTALFAWLFARANGGEFILRIEDTDRARSTEEFLQNILEDMQWLGLDFEEMYRQSERVDIHLQHAERLLAEGKAYRCYCTPEDLEERRKQQQARGQNPKYDGRCREVSPEEAKDMPSVVRLKMPLEGTTEFDDLVFGHIEVSNDELDDLILIRSDGSPTFNLACALDDHAMGITHVIRGDDHIANTHKQIHILQAFDYPVPKYGHLSTILGPDKTRLSKRHGATSIDWYKQNGYLPAAMINYLVRLGWAFGDEEFFNRQDLIEKFSLDNVNKSPAVFNPEKLLWLNGEHIRAAKPEDLLPHWRPFLEREGLIKTTDSGISLCPEQWGEGAEIRSEAWLLEVIGTLQPRSKDLLEMTQMGRFYFIKDIQYDEKAMKKHVKEKSKVLLEDLIEGIEAMEEPLQEEGLENLFKEIIEKRESKMLKVAMPARVALSGGSVSPGIFEVVRLLGKDESLRRLKLLTEKIG